MSCTWRSFLTVVLLTESIPDVCLTYVMTPCLQDNEMIVGQLQGQSEMLRNRVTVRIGGGDADAQRRKRGDEMRKALLSDDGMDDEEEDMQKTQRKTRGLGYLVRRVNAFVDRRMPFLNDIKLIQARYGHSVSAYFAFYYWLIVTYYWLGLASLALCVYHAFWLLGHGRSLSYLFMSSGVLPQLMVYSSFDPQERLMYVSMLLGFTLMLLAVALSKWVKEDRAAKSLDATEAELQVPTAHTTTHSVGNTPFKHSRSDGGHVVIYKSTMNTILFLETLCVLG